MGDDMNERLKELAVQAYEEVQITPTAIWRWVREGNVYVSRLTQEHMDQFKQDLENSRKALAKPEQEPMAWRNAAIRLGEDLYSVGPNGYYEMTAKQWLDWALNVVNTAPPRKPWQELTDDEIHKIIDCCTPNNAAQEELNDFARAVRFVEAKLKEKNT